MTQKMKLAHKTPPPKTDSLKTGAPGLTIWRLAKLVKPEWRLVTIGSIALLIGSLLNLALPEAVRTLVNADNGAALLAHPWRAALIISALFAAQATAFYLRSLYFGIVGQRTIRCVRQDLFERIVARQIGIFDQERSADLVARLTTDAGLLQDVVSIKLSVFVRYSLQVLAGVVVMFVLSWRLSAALLLCLPLLVGISLVLGRRLKRVSAAQQSALGVSAAQADEAFREIRSVHAFNAQRYFASRYGATLQKILTFGNQRASIAAFFSSFVSFLMNISLVAVIVYGVTLVDSASLTRGDLVAFLMYGAIVAVSFSFVAGGYTELLNALGACERVFELLDAPEQERIIGNEVDSAAASKRVDFNEIRFEKVSFSYPSRANQTVLDNVSFVLRRGTRTALVGPSGAGKSSIAALLLRFYQPASGAILVDGADLSSLPKSQWRNGIAYVPQEPALFSGSVRENLLLADPSASSSALEQACGKARILDFVNSLPQGFETEVGERGTQLSAGQKQRLVVARAFLRQPALLILDEATSSLDAENEFLVTEAIATLEREVTTLVIAHRLSTIKTADQIVVLSAGQVVQTGKHHELAVNGGLYSSLLARSEESIKPQPEVYILS